MTLRIKNRFGVCVFLMCGLVFAIEVRGIIISRKTAARAQARLELKLQELRRCEANVPSLTEKNAALIEAQLVRGRRVLDDLEAELKGRDEEGMGAGRGTAVPAARMDAFFELANFVANTRELATRAGVAVRSDERFGFSNYAVEGPPAELIPSVFRQTFTLRHLLETLLEARPQRLISVQRELPVSVSTNSRTPGSGRLSSSAPDRLTPDFFALDPRWSVRVQGAIEGQAFRLIFVGSTETLRIFLNRLAVLELPVAMRCIEVEPAAVLEVAPALPKASAANSVVLTSEPDDPDGDAAVPVVTPGFSKFTVTVESVRLVPANHAPPVNGATIPQV